MVLEQADYPQRVKRILRHSLIIFGLFVIGSFTPFSAIFLGLALGTLASIINFLLLVRVVTKIGELATTQNVHNKKKMVFPGMTSRFATAILAVMVVYKFPTDIHLFPTLFGLFTTQIISIVDGIRYH